MDCSDYIHFVFKILGANQPFRNNISRSGPAEYDNFKLIHIYILLSMKPWGLRPKMFQTSVGVLPAPVRVPSQRPLAPSVASVTSVVNDKGYNEMIRPLTYN